jgi:hypothetical protein
MRFLMTPMCRVLKDVHGCTPSQRLARQTACGAPRGLAIDVNDASLVSVRRMLSNFRTVGTRYLSAHDIDEYRHQGLPHDVSYFAVPN